MISFVLLSHSVYHETFRFAKGCMNAFNGEMILRQVMEDFKKYRANVLHNQADKLFEKDVSNLIKDLFRVQHGVDYDKELYDHLGEIIASEEDIKKVEKELQELFR